MILYALTINKKNLIVNRKMYAVRFILPDCERDLSEWLHNAYEQGGENAVIPLHSHTLSSTHPVSLNMNIIFRGQFRPYTFVNSLPLVFWSGAECNESSVFYFAGVKVRAASLFHLTGCLSRIKSTWFHGFILVCLREPLRNSSILSFLHLIQNIVNHTSSSGYLSIA